MDIEYDGGNLDVVGQLIRKRNMTDNPRTIRIIGKHILGGCQEQLLVYISGVGGTGKSHVINATPET
jgi:hypothetical protein